MSVKMSKPAKLPEMPDEGVTWRTYLYYGARRAAKTLCYVGGTAAAVAGVAIMKGVPPGPALIGAGLVAIGSSAVMGTEKALKEKKKSQHESWTEVFDLIIKFVELIVRLVRKGRK